MSQLPSASGEIPEQGPLAVLVAADRRRTTGWLRFVSDSGVAGEVALLRGEPCAEGAQALETFLDLEAGHFELVQVLPPLPVTRGDGSAREGRLGAHSPAGLMRYCEAAGLTGALTLTREERRAGLLYDAGELVAVQMLGQGDESVPEVLAWEDGTFRVEAWADFPSLPAPSEAPEDSVSIELVGFEEVDSGEQTLLRVIDVDFASIVEAPAAPAEPESEAPRRERRDATVRVIYLGAPKPPSEPPPREPARVEPPPAKPAGTLPPAVTAPPRRRRERRTDAATLPSAAPPVTPVEELLYSPPSGDIPTFRSYVREVGLAPLFALTLGAVTFLAAIAYPFLVR